MELGSGVSAEPGATRDDALRPTGGHGSFGDRKLTSQHRAKTGSEPFEESGPTTDIMAPEGPEPVATGEAQRTRGCDRLSLCPRGAEQSLARELSFAPPGRNRRNHFHGFHPWLQAYAPSGRSRPRRGAQVRCPVGAGTHRSGADACPAAGSQLAAEPFAGDNSSLAFKRRQG